MILVPLGALSKKLLLQMNLSGRSKSPVKRMTIRNRIAMTPMGTNYGETSGEMSNRHMNYYSLRAKGGVGLIILENANVEYPVGSNGTSQIRIDHDSFMPRYYQLVEKIDSNYMPDGWCSCQAKAVKEKFGKPVINAGNYRDPKVVEQVLESGNVATIFDMINNLNAGKYPDDFCKGKKVVVKTPEGEIKELEFDLGFNCLGMRANNPLLPALEEEFGDTDTFVYPIGDSVRARRIMEGTMDGRAILNVLEFKGFLDLDEIEQK